MRFETLSVRAGGEPEPTTGDVAPPLHLATTFVHGPAGEVAHGRLYGREGNPTQDRLETALAALDGGERALAFASGVAAGATLLQALPAGARVLFHRDLYYGFRVLAEEQLPGWGKSAGYADLADEAATAAALAERPAVVWVESPTNPRLEIVDLAALAERAHRAGALFVVDGTFATPALQRPLALGADLVLHSTTKYLGGHSDVLGGALVFRERGALAERCERLRHDLGAVASPFSSWLVLRGLRTLACRMARHCDNALALARAVVGHPALSAVLYPGLESHPGHDIAARQMRAFGGMISLRFRGGADAAFAAASRLRLFTVATSLGGVESLAEHRASVEGPNTTAPPDLLRLSVGIEHPDDLIEDVVQALG